MSQCDGFWKCCANTSVSMRHGSPTPTDQRTGLLHFQWKTALVPGLRLRASSEQKRHCRRRRLRQTGKLALGTYTKPLEVNMLTVNRRSTTRRSAKRPMRSKGIGKREKAQWPTTPPRCCYCHDLQFSGRCTVERGTSDGSQRSSTPMIF